MLSAWLEQALKSFASVAALAASYGSTRLSAPNTCKHALSPCFPCHQNLTHIIVLHHAAHIFASLPLISLRIFCKAFGALLSYDMLATPDDQDGVKGG